MANVSAIQSGASQLVMASWQRFARWWLSGLKEVIPAAWLDWADGEAKPKVMVWCDADAVVCRLTSAAGAVEVRFPLLVSMPPRSQPGSSRMASAGTR